MVPADINGKVLKKFLKDLGKKNNVKFLNAGVQYRLAQMALNKLIKKFLPLGDDLIKLRPMCLYKAVLMDIPRKMDSLGARHQMSIAVHELEHVNRIKEFVERGGDIGGWYYHYFADADFRALQEVFAIVAQRTVERVLYGKLDTSLNVEQMCIDYLLPPSSMRKAAKVFDRQMARLSKRPQWYALTNAATDALRLIREG